MDEAITRQEHLDTVFGPQGTAEGVGLGWVITTTTDGWTGGDGTQYHIIPPPYPTAGNGGTYTVLPWRRQTRAKRTPPDPTRCPQLSIRKKGEICKLINKVCIRKKETCAYYEDWLDSQKKTKEVKEVNDNEVPRELIDY